MLENVRGISIQGRCFADKTELPCYKTEKHRICVIYGRNGSGKSTISEGCSRIAAGTESDDLTAELIDSAGNTVLLEPDERICVFDERYIDENVKIDDDGLGTIVLLGKQVDLQSKIEECKSARDKAEEEYIKAKTEYERYADKKDSISPLFYLEDIKKTLIQRWAKVDQKIKGNSIRSSVTDALIEEIGSIVVAQSAKEKLDEQLNQLISLLDKIIVSKQVYPEAIKQVQIKMNFDKEFCQCIEKQIEKPVLTEREKMILEAIHQGHQTRTEEARQTFAKEDTSVCPYCYQPVCKEYKKNLVESISRVLNRDVDEHKAELRQISFPEISGDYAQYIGLDQDLVIAIQKQIAKCEKTIARYKKAIDEKINNIYTPVVLTSFGLEDEIEQLNRLLILLENKRVEFEKASQDIKNRKKEAIRINKKIAKIEIKHQYASFLLQKTCEEEALKKRDRLYDGYQAAVKKLDCLQQEKSSESLAIQHINNSLDYIFFQKGRLSIALKDGKYYLKSNGENVKPKNVSQGERNIIALCYFFTKILSHQEVGKLYTSREFVVIDDPVSSFDFENKVGILSLLRYQIEKIISGNQQSKVLLLSHDLTTIFDVKKIMKELYGEENAKKSAVKYSVNELEQRRLKAFGDKRSEYGALLNAIYNYANGDMQEAYLEIGNFMRRALEAFSSFTYRNSIDKVLLNKGVLEDLGSCSKYFENLMWRLVLHGESHYEEQVYNFHDGVNFFEFISEEEKRKTAKDILCFMYLLNKHHLEAYLKDIPSAIDNIQIWVNAIPTNEEIELEKISESRIIKLFDLPISAGTGTFIIDNEVDGIDYPTNNQECDFALRISGDSMEPDIPDRAVVLVKNVDKLIGGEIGAFCLNQNTYCKKLIYKNGKAFLCSINSKYAPIEIKDTDQLTVYGKVIDIVI